ncbi:MAG: AbgT family transporter [Tissierellia bacterium]|nr:AbgT family transporter [Tissierellia bacterium]
MTEKQKTGGFLGWVERVGNKIPHPFILFLSLMVIIAIISFVASLMGAQTINPTNGEEVIIKNILSGEGITFALTTTVKNFTGFAPLGLVLTMTLGIGMAEDVGLMSAFMRKTILGVPDKFVVFTIMLIGICGNIASDAAIIIVPTLAAMIYLYIGKNPIAGIAIGYASTTAGFSANLFPAGTDALLAGITNEASAIVGAPNIELTANWWIMIVSTFVLAITGTIVNNKIIEPRLGKYHGSHEVSREKVSELESKGLKNAGIALLVYIAIIVAACIPQSSFFRNAETGSLLTGSPLMASIIPLILLLFITVAIAYGKAVGEIKKAADVPKIMQGAIEKMASFIVLAFIIGQFIAWFNWTNMGLFLAVTFANALSSAGFTGIPLFVMYVLLCTFVNLFIGSGSAKWALLAPIFVPMMFLLGYHPAWTQFLYRVGDSCTNVITPLFPYFPIILSFINDYDEEAGTGTLLSIMIPYAVIFLIVWTLLAIVWYLFIPLPLGTGGFIHI